MLTVSEAARRTRRDPETVRRWIRSGRLKATRIGTQHLIDEDDEAWRIADRLGWAKTYNAEYLALARLLRCRLLTTDAKLKASGSEVAKVIGPTDL